jgi:hypothetical protein
MNEAKMIELAEELLRSAKAGKLHWKEGVRKESYAVDFPDMSILIARRPVGIFRLTLLNDRGEAVESLSSDLMDNTTKTLQKIYNIAQQQALDVTGDIEKALTYLKQA